MRPCDTCGKPTAVSNSYCEHSAALDRLREENERLRSEISGKGALRVELLKSLEDERDRYRDALYSAKSLCEDEYSRAACRVIEKALRDDA